MSKKELEGHLYLIGTLFVILIAPFLLILLSYLEIISGTAGYVAALGVLGTGAYIIGGWILTVIADKEDGQRESAR